MRMRFPLPVVVLAIVAGCGPRVGAPSLAPRPGEARPIELPDAEREAPGTVDPTLADRIAAALASARAADAAFATARAASERAVGAADRAARGEEAWVVAQQALSNLDIMRGPVREAAGAIAALRLDPSAAGPADRAAIDAAATQVDALDTSEVQALTVLQARLR